MNKSRPPAGHVNVRAEEKEEQKKRAQRARREEEENVFVSTGTDERRSRGKEVGTYRGRQGWSVRGG